MNAPRQPAAYEPAFAMWPAPGRDCYYVSRGVRHGQEFAATGETEPYLNRDVAMTAAQGLLREGVPGYMVEFDAGPLRIIEPCLPQQQQLERYVVISSTHDDGVALEVVDATSADEAAERREALGRALGGGHVHFCKSLDDWAAQLAEIRSRSARETEADFHHFERNALRSSMDADLHQLRAGFDMLALAPTASALER